MSFSERMGIAKPKEIQIDDLDEETRSSLWNFCRKHALVENNDDVFISKTDGIAVLMCTNFYKIPVDNLPKYQSQFISTQLKIFNDAPWYQILDLVEFISKSIERPVFFRSNINAILEREKSAYRFIGDQIAPLTNELEISEVRAASEQPDRFAPVTDHIKAALTCFSAKPAADYRNTIKEAISAVEAAARIVTGKPKATLGDALKLIDMHTAMRDSLSKLYGYTSDAGGIRHALSDASKVDEADARYMLVTCSACANFLISKMPS